MIVILFNQIYLAHKHKSYDWIDVNSYTFNDFVIEERITIFEGYDIDYGYEYLLFDKKDLKTPIKKINNLDEAISDVTTDIFYDQDYLTNKKKQAGKYFVGDQKYYLLTLSGNAILYKSDNDEFVAKLVIDREIINTNDLDFAIIYEEKNSMCYQMGPYLIYKDGDNYGQRYLDKRSKTINPRAPKELRMVCNEIKKHKAEKNLKIVGVSKYAITKWLDDLANQEDGFNESKGRFS